MRKIRLTFKYTFKPNKLQKEIIEETTWHCVKIYNILNYEIEQGKQRIYSNSSINIQSSKIYKRYREENWHSKYLHSHTMQEVIIGLIGDHKSYQAIEEKYKKGNNKIKGKPNKPRYKKDNIQIIYTKYAIRTEGNKIKLSISKEMRRKVWSKEFKFFNTKEIKKANRLFKDKNDKDRKEDRREM